MTGAVPGTMPPPAPPPVSAGALHRVTDATVIIETIRVLLPDLPIDADFPAMVARPETVALMDDHRTALFIFVWRGPGTYWLGAAVAANPAQLKAWAGLAVKGLRAVTKRSGAIWSINDGSPGSAQIVKAFSMVPTKDVAQDFMVKPYPIWRRGFT